MLRDLKLKPLSLVLALLLSSPENALRHPPCCYHGAPPRRGLQVELSGQRARAHARHGAPARRQPCHRLPLPPLAQRPPPQRRQHVRASGHVLCPLTCPLCCAPHKYNQSPARPVQVCRSSLPGRKEYFPLPAYSQQRPQVSQ